MALLSLHVLMFSWAHTRNSIGPRVHHGTHSQIFLAVNFHIVMIFSHFTTSMNESALSTAKGKYIVNLHTKEKC